MVMYPHTKGVKDNHRRTTDHNGGFLLGCPSLISINKVVGRGAVFTAPKPFQSNLVFSFPEKLYKEKFFK
jgi:hypothetical protein